MTSSHVPPVLGARSRTVVSATPETTASSPSSSGVRLAPRKVRPLTLQNAPATPSSTPAPPVSAAVQNRPVPSSSVPAQEASSVSEPLAASSSPLLDSASAQPESQGINPFVRLADRAHLSFMSQETALNEAIETLSQHSAPVVLDRATHARLQLYAPAALEVIYGSSSSPVVTSVTAPAPVVSTPEPAPVVTAVTAPAPVVSTPEPAPVVAAVTAPAPVVSMPEPAPVIAAVTAPAPVVSTPEPAPVVAAVTAPAPVVSMPEPAPVIAAVTAPAPVVSMPEPAPVVAAVTAPAPSIEPLSTAQLLIKSSTSNRVPPVVETIVSAADSSIPFVEISKLLHKPSREQQEATASSPVDSPFRGSNNTHSVQRSSSQRVLEQASSKSVKPIPLPLSSQGSLATSKAQRSIEPPSSSVIVARNAFLGFFLMYIEDFYAHIGQPLMSLWTHKFSLIKILFHTLIPLLMMYQFSHWNPTFEAQVYSGGWTSTLPKLIWLYSVSAFLWTLIYIFIFRVLLKFKFDLNRFERMGRGFLTSHHD